MQSTFNHKVPPILYNNKHTEKWVQTEFGLQLLCLESTDMSKLDPMSLCKSP